MVKAVNIYTGTYGALFDLFVDNKPSYNDGNSITHTYTVASSYNRENPVFPLIVIEEDAVDTKLNNLDGSGEEYFIDVKLEFYAKEKEGKKAISAGKQQILKTLIDNQNFLKSNHGVLLREDFWDDTGIGTFADNNQIINTSSVILKLKLQ